MHCNAGCERSRRSVGVVALSLALALGLSACATGPGQDAQSVLQRTEQAMGGAALATIRYAGRGTGATFGQAFAPGMAWPKINYSSFARVADYNNAAFREDAARTRAEPNGGGAVPLMGTGEQRTTGLVKGASAWNMVGPAPVPAALALAGRTHDLWTTPHGVIKAAQKNNATVQTVREDGRTLTTLSFSQAPYFTATAFINADDLIERVESVVPHPVLGDTPVVTHYTNYQAVAGIKFPMRIRQTMGGFEVLDLAVAEVQANLPVSIDVPALVLGASERVVAEKAANGVWFLAGGSHNSVAIEMADHVIVVESPLSDGRALPVMAEARKLVPGKDIRYVINSHHHFDHAGGLRAAAAQGAELITSGPARAYFEQVMANPNRVSPDALEKSGKKVRISEVNGKRVLTDGQRVVEVYFIESSVHAQGFMMVYLPSEKLLIEADAYTPGAPGSAPPAVPNGNTVNLVQNIERLKLDVERVLPLHGRMVPVAELYAFAGRKR